MRAFFWIALFACGGVATPNPDASSDATTDSSSNGDGTTNDSPSDTTNGDGNNDCTPPNTQCQNPCPQGTICLRTSGPGPGKDLGCTNIPSSCVNGVATCDCMKQCFCTGPMNTCMMGSGVKELICNNGAVSRREFKTDIAYLTDDERADLATQTLAIPLATYLYKNDPSKTHLGFIIDDQPAQSFAVEADRTHVDEYGYTSMLLVTVQEQQRQIDALQKRLDAIERKK